MEFVALSTQECNVFADQDPYLKKVFQGTVPCDGLPRHPKKKPVILSTPIRQDNPVNIGLPYG